MAAGLAPAPGGQPCHGHLRRFPGAAQGEAAPEAGACQAAVAAFELKVLGQRNQSDGVGEEMRAGGKVGWVGEPGNREEKGMEETLKWRGIKGGCEKGKRVEGNEEKQCKRHVRYSSLRHS